MEGAGLPKKKSFFSLPEKSLVNKFLLLQSILALCRSLGSYHFIARIEDPHGYDGDIPFMF